MSEANFLPYQTSKTSRPGSVLFVCAMNAIRSPMAEYIARDIFPADMEFQSAGSFPGYVDPFMPSVMQERNIDIKLVSKRGVEENPTSFKEFFDTRPKSNLSLS